jgi:large subunit ribosomal protein L18
MSKRTPQSASGLRDRRHRRIRARVKGTADRPRLAVYRSNAYVYAQIIDDERGVTLVSATNRGAKKKLTLMEAARDIGTSIAKAASEKGISKVVFDRGGFNYGGRIAALADAARNGGLKF